MKRSIPWLACAALTTYAAHADVQFGVSAGVGQSDNINRVEENPESQSIASLGLDLDWDRVGTRLDGGAAVNLAYTEYLDDAYDSELGGTADANLLFKLVPDRFSWMFQDSFGQAQADPFVPSTPDSRENINYFTTGPEFTARLGSVAAMRLSGRLSLVDYEESPLDAERATYGIAFVRQPSEASEISLNGYFEQVEFDDTPESNYDRKSVYLGYQIQGSRTDLTAELGYTEVTPENGLSEGDEAPLVSLVLNRELSSSSFLMLRAGTQLTDAGDVMREFVGEGGGISTGGGAGIAASADPFENREFAATYRFVRRRTELSLGASYNQNRYLNDTVLDRDRIVYSASVTRRIGEYLDLSLHVNLTDEDFVSIEGESQEVEYGAALQWRMGRELSLRLTYDYSERDATDGLGGYDENRVWLSLIWQRRHQTGQAPR